jgi:hypothetical protein
MFVNEPYWLKEAYESPINATDTGYVMRNVYLSRKTLILFLILFGKEKNFLDFAGGYGMLTRLMRDYGLSFFTDDVYTENLFAKGFEYKEQKIEALTCFECFEHLPNPPEEINSMLAISSNILFSTVLLPKTKIPEKDWNYYGLNHGQHVSFYTEETFKYIAKKHGINFYTDHKNLHMFSKIKLPNFIFISILFLTKFQIDLLFRKILKSKTVSDHDTLKEKGLI